MGAPLKRSSGPAIEKISDMVSLLSSLQEGDILFIDEIHRLRTVVEEVLYTAMEDFTIDIMIGSGTGATAVKMPLPRFTLVGATTRLALLSNPLRDRFEHVLKLDFYELDDLVHIAARSLNLLDVPLSPSASQMIAERSRGTPRIVNRFARILRDHSVLDQDVTDGGVLERIFASLGVDERGLDRLDHAYLALLRRSALRPLGLSTLAATLGEDEGTIEDVVEPFLLKQGYIEKTPR